jgi:hypothetical protein
VAVAGTRLTPSRADDKALACDGGGGGPAAVTVGGVTVPDARRNEGGADGREEWVGGRTSVVTRDDDTCSVCERDGIFKLKPDDMMMPQARKCATHGQCKHAHTHLRTCFSIFFFSDLKRIGTHVQLKHSGKHIISKPR